MALQYVGSGALSPSNQGTHCQGDCDNDNDCQGEMYCHQRDDKDPIPGCGPGGDGDKSNADGRSDVVLYPVRTSTS